MVVKAVFNHWWHGNRYQPDDIMPATEEQAKRLTSSGQAYYDFEDSEKPKAVSLEDIDPNEYVNMSNTKKEIEQFLDRYGIEYSEYMTKSELLDLIE